MFFRERGCVVVVEAQIGGARQKDKIDVYVTFRQHGIECHWVIECKLWKRHVEKADVLILKGVVENIGADKGIIFCENGFQSGALEAARNTNVLLITSLQEFKRTFRLDETKTALVYHDSEQSGAPPIHAFPNGDQPQHLLLYGHRVFVANWEPGNITIVESTRQQNRSRASFNWINTRLRLALPKSQQSVNIRLATWHARAVIFLLGKFSLNLSSL